MRKPTTGRSRRVQVVTSGQPIAPPDDAPPIHWRLGTWRHTLAAGKLAEPAPCREPIPVPAPSSRMGSLPAQCAWRSEETPGRQVSHCHIGSVCHTTDTFSWRTTWDLADPLQNIWRAGRTALYLDITRFAFLGCNPQLNFMAIRGRHESHLEAAKANGPPMTARI